MTSNKHSSGQGMSNTGTYTDEHHGETHNWARVCVCPSLSVLRVLCSKAH